MDWKMVWSTFALIFLAELGDKTQLATMSLAAKSGRASSVFLGAALALVSTSLLGVLLGEAVTQFVPTRYIHLGAGALFVLMGILLLAGKV